MRPRRLLLLGALFGTLAQPFAVHGQGQLCRTAAVGTLSQYCASEALVANSRGRLQVLAFAGLVACSSTTKGYFVFITDSNTSTFNANITAGGGANAGLAVCDGTNWKFH